MKLNIRNAAADLVLLVAWLVAALALVCAGFDLGRKSVKPGTVIKSDTVIVVKHDTTLIDSPAPIVKEVIRTEYLAVTDTVRINDTAYIPVPIERKVYEDSLYRAVISGYHPNLDSLWVYNTTHYVTVTNTVKEKASKWGFGAAAGPSVMIDAKGSLRAGFGLTAGLRYNF